jgi:hypothetical protein
MRFVYGGGWQNVDAALRAAGQRKSSRQVWVMLSTKQVRASCAARWLTFSPDTW